MCQKQSSQFDVTYQTRLRDWNSRASVRSAPMRTYKADDKSLPFSPELIPLLAHPAFANRSPKVSHTVMAQKLFTYLSFTEYLELLAVIPASTDLRNHQVPFLVPNELKRDAGKIVTDEAHHAECAADLAEQIAAATDDKPYRIGSPAFLRKLYKAQGRFIGCTRNLAGLTFTAVSETLITGTLTKVPMDGRVHPDIRAVITDHARDEAQHHACYSEVIRIMWEQIGPGQRDKIGPLFGEFIEAFLAPDLVAELNWLEAAGFEAHEAKKIVEETYEALDLGAVYRESARPTLTMLKRFGLLDHPATYDALAKRDLVG